MKRKYMHMSVLIEGPKQPGNDLNLYLGLLKEELDTLWRTPVITWDAHDGRYFPMEAAMLTTVHDYLGLGYVAGQVATDTVDARGAWMTQCITSYLRNPGLQKPCSWDIEDGFLTMTH